MDDALRLLARQGDVQIVFDPADVAGARSPAVRGSMSVREALSRLLSGTALEYAIAGKDTIAVKAHQAPKRAPVATPAPPTSKQSDPPQERRDPGVLEEVLVTAQKRSERTLDVPISITAVSGERLAESGIQRAYDLNQIVPGMRFDDDGGNPQPSIRGIVSLVDGPGVSSAVAVYEDGFYVPRLQSLPFEFNAIDSIQVLKGPQGTLFGRNATGGAILISTA